jgi:hypothetical protein
MRVGLEAQSRQMKTELGAPTDREASAPLLKSVIITEGLSSVDGATRPRNPAAQAGFLFAETQGALPAAAPYRSRPCVQGGRSVTEAVPASSP